MRDRHLDTIISEEEVLKPAKEIERITKRIITKRTMTGFITMYGKVRLTMAQYEHMAAVMNETECSITMPSH